MIIALLVLFVNDCFTGKKCPGMSPWWWLWKSISLFLIWKGYLWWRELNYTLFYSFNAIIFYFKSKQNLDVIITIYFIIFLELVFKIFYYVTLLSEIKLNIFIHFFFLFCKMETMSYVNLDLSGLYAVCWLACIKLQHKNCIATSVFAKVRDCRIWIISQEIIV